MSFYGAVETDTGSLFLIYLKRGIVGDSALTFLTSISAAKGGNYEEVNEWITSLEAKGGEAFKDALDVLLKCFYVGTDLDVFEPDEYDFYCARYPGAKNKVTEEGFRSNILYVKSTWTDFDLVKKSVGIFNNTTRKLNSSHLWLYTERTAGDFEAIEETLNVLSTRFPTVARLKFW